MDITDGDRSAEGQTVESAPVPMSPGWPPAELPEHERGLPQVGLPRPIVHDKVSES